MRELSLCELLRTGELHIVFLCSSGDSGFCVWWERVLLSGILCEEVI